MERLAYVRVSSIEQNEARQVEALEKHNIDKWYIEKVSAKDRNRPKLKELLDYARKGDTIYIHDFSRLARSTKDLLDIIDQLEEKQVTLISNKENLDTGTATGKLLVTMIAAINEFERANMLERQREGIAIAVKKGKYKGKQPIKINEKKFNELLEDVERGYITKVEMAEKLGISRATLYRRLKEFEDNKVDELEEYKMNYEKIKKGYIED